MKNESVITAVSKLRQEVGANGAAPLRSESDMETYVANANEYPLQEALLILDDMLKFALILIPLAIIGWFIFCFVGE